MKNDPSLKDAYGRHGDPSWVDSQDLEKISWEVKRKEAFTNFSFAVVDAGDQKPVTPLGSTYFNIALYDGDNLEASWDLPGKQANGNVQWVELAFDRAIKNFRLLLSAGHNDGYGITSVSAVCR
jgi:hypothetical protein